jgi:hypothetical protein
MWIARAASLASSPVPKFRLRQICLVFILSAHVLSVRAAPLFGQHFPHGTDAVAYLYGPHGTWREQTNTYYGWNFYKGCETPNHPYDPQAILREAAVSNTTAPDANCILHGDVNNNGEIADDAIKGFAFHEHAGRGVHGEQTSAPFYQFWFDDNWVARYVSQTYERPEPIGLHDSGEPIRWRVVGGNNTQWTPYPETSPHIDQIALNGLFKLNAGDFAGGLAAWNTIKSSSDAAYDATRGRYDYSFSADAIYYYGLWAILSERLLARRATFDQRAEVLQHAMSLHVMLLALQEKNPEGDRLGWRTSTGEHALINTETTSLAVLALGAHASWVLEPGYEPLSSGAGNYTHEHETLSAHAGQSVPGHVSFGPFWTLAPGSYDVEFALRSSAERVDTQLATLDVYDGTAVVAAKVIEGADAPTGNQWRRYVLAAEIANTSNLTQFRVFWHGAYDLDVGAIRVTQHAEETVPSAPEDPAAAPQEPPYPAVESSCTAPKAKPTGDGRLQKLLQRGIETYVKYLS